MLYHAFDVEARANLKISKDVTSKNDNALMYVNE